MKPFEEHSIVAGKEVRGGLQEWGWFSLGPAQHPEDATFGIEIKTNTDRVALGRFLINLGSKLATPKSNRT